MLHIPAKDALVPQCAFQSQEGEGHPEAEPPLLQLINPSLTCIHRDGLSQPGHSAEPRLGGGVNPQGDVIKIAGLPRALLGLKRRLKV